LFTLRYTEEAEQHYESLKTARGKQAEYKAVVKALRFLAENPRHPGLNTHEYESLTGPAGVKVWEAYAQNKTPGAYRIFFSYYPPKTNTITVIAILPHH